LEDHAQVIGVLGFMPASLVPSDVQNQIFASARSDEQDVNMFATLALARWDNLTEHPDVMESRVGLVRSSEAWDCIQGFVPESRALEILGVLYASKPSDFAPALAATLKNLGPLALQQALQVMRWAHRASHKSRAPKVLWDAVLALVKNSDTDFVPLADCIYTLSQLDRTRFPKFNWVSICNEWDVRVREVLADELAGEVYTSAQSEKEAFDLLLHLTRDREYQVRRSAYRGLSRLDYARFRELCLEWTATPEVALRKRAAEACVWFDTDSEADEAPSLLAQLSADVEPGVRQAAERSRDERRRRTWASAYLEQVTLTDNESNHSILDRWAYGSALTAVGNDDTIRSLRSFAGSRRWAPHIKHWFRRLLTDMERQWDEAKKSYPGTWPD
jgi:HEAT repeats